MKQMHVRLIMSIAVNWDLSFNFLICWIREGLKNKNKMDLSIFGFGMSSRWESHKFGNTFLANQSKSKL